MGGMSLGGAFFEFTGDERSLVVAGAKAEAAAKANYQAIAKEAGVSAAAVERSANRVMAAQEKAGRAEKARADASAAATLKIIQADRKATDEAVKSVQRMAQASQAASKAREQSVAGNASLMASLTTVAAGYATLDKAISVAGDSLKFIAEETQRANQSQFALTATYKASAGVYTQFAAQQSEITKRSKIEYEQAAVAFGSLNKNYAIGATQVKELTKRAADLAAVKGIALPEAAGRLESALRGEAEAAEFLGLTLNSDYLKKFADMTAEQRKNWETLDPLIKAQITYREILKQTDPVLGAAAKRANEQAGAMDRIKKAQSDLAISLGKELQPELSGTARGFEKVTEWIDQAIKKMVDWKKIAGSVGQGEIQVGPDLGLPGSIPGPTPAQAEAASEGRAAFDRAQAERKEQAKRDLEAAEKAAKDRVKVETEAIDAERKAKEQWYSEERQRIEARRTYHLEDIETRRDAALAGIKAEAEAAKKASEDAIEQAGRRRESEHAAADEAYDQVKTAVDAEKVRLDTVRELEDRDREDHRAKEDRELDEARSREDAEVKATADAVQKKRSLEDQARDDRRRADDQDRARRREEDDRELQEDREREDRAEEARAQARTRRRQQEDRERTANRQAEDRALSDARAAEDAALEASQSQRLATIKSEHDARIQVIDDEIEAIGRRAEEDARARDKVHEQVLAGFKDEEEAAQSAHDQRMDELDELARAEDDRHRKALTDIDAEKDARLRAIDAELGLLDAADDAEARAKRDQQLRDAVTNAEFGVKRAQSTGNQSEIVKAEQELAAAVDAIRQAGVKDDRDAQRDILRARKQTIADEAAAAKLAEDDRNRAREEELRLEREATKKALDDELAAIGVRRGAYQTEYDEETVRIADLLAARLDELAKRKEAEQAAHDASLAKLQAELDAEKKRIADRRLDEDRDRDDRRTKEDQERDDRRTKEDDRLNKDRQRLSDRRKDEDEDRADRRRKEDDERTASRLAQDRYRQDERAAQDVEAQKNNERRQLQRQDEDRVLADSRHEQDRRRADERQEEDKALAVQLAAAESTREMERRKVELHYNGPNGLITQLKKAMSDAEGEYSRRLAAASLSFEAERKAAERIYTNPEGNGLLQLLEKARSSEIEKLNKSKEDWGKWQEKVSADIKKAQEDLDAFVKSGANIPGGGSPGGGGSAAPPPTGGWEKAAHDAAVKAGFSDPAVFVKQIKQESGNFDPDVISGKRKSSAGAIGIAQFMPGTAQALGVDPLDPMAALAAAAKYMTKMEKQYAGFHGRAGIINALWGYNAGEGNLQKGILPEETVKYLRIILGGSYGFDSGHLFRDPTMTINARTGKTAWIAEKRPELLVSGAKTADFLNTPKRALGGGRMAPAPQFSMPDTYGQAMASAQLAMSAAGSASGPRQELHATIQVGDMILGKMVVRGMQLELARSGSLPGMPR